MLATSVKCAVFQKCDSERLKAAISEYTVSPDNVVAVCRNPIGSTGWTMRQSRQEQCKADV